MTNSLLLSNKYQVLGWILFILFGILGLANMYFEFRLGFLALPIRTEPGLGTFTDFNLTNEIALAGTVIGLLLIAFSKELIEDEYISFLRLTSWQWSILISYVFLIVFSFIFYGLSFFTVLIYNIFLVPLIFIVRFRFCLYRLNAEKNTDEK